MVGTKPEIAGHTPSFPTQCLVGCSPVLPKYLQHRYGNGASVSFVKRERHKLQELERERERERDVPQGHRPVPPSSPHHGGGGQVILVPRKSRSNISAGLNKKAGYGPETWVRCKNLWYRGCGVGSALCTSGSQDVKRCVQVTKHGDVIDRTWDSAREPVASEHTVWRGEENVKYYSKRAQQGSRCTYMDCTLSRSPSSSGIGPIKRFSFKNRPKRLVSEPSVVGMVPVNWLSERLRTLRCRELANSLGIVPESLLELK